MDILQEDRLDRSPLSKINASRVTQHILGYPKSGKTNELFARAIHAAKEGARALLVSQNPIEAAALQEKLWLQQQQSPNPDFHLDVLYSHALIDELLKKLFPKLGFFSVPNWVTKDNGLSQKTANPLQAPTISLPAAIAQLAAPNALSNKDYHQAGYRYQSIFVDDATLQPGYLHNILQKMLLPGGKLVEVRHRTNPHQLYQLHHSQNGSKNRHLLSIQPIPRAPTRPNPPLIGRWAISSLKKIILDQYEFSYGAQKKTSIDIALGLPLGDKAEAPLDLDHPWTEAKRWRAYLLEHKERLEPNPYSSTRFQIELPAPGLHATAGSCATTHCRRQKKPPDAPTVRIYCQPYFTLYGQFFDWLLLPYLDNDYLPKNPHRQLQYLWFLASRAKIVLAGYQNLRSLPNWLLNTDHPQRCTLEKSVLIEMKS